MKKLFNIIRKHYEPFIFYSTFFFSFLIIILSFFFIVSSHAQESGTIEAQPGDSDYMHPIHLGWDSERKFYEQQNLGQPCRGGIADCRPRLRLYFICVNGRWLTYSSCPF